MIEATKEAEGKEKPMKVEAKLEERAASRQFGTRD